MRGHHPVDPAGQNEVAVFGSQGAVDDAEYVGRSVFGRFDHGDRLI